MTNATVTPSVLETLTSIEEKINKCLELMQAALVYKAPRFKEYWDVKKMCLPLFKEVAVAESRTALWERYIAISEEARQLKKILDEESSFVSQQIDLAISATEADLKAFQEGSRKAVWELPQECQFIEPKKGSYEAVQCEIGDLNHLATRLNMLRKELIKTEMRVRQKTKFFDRLSKAGDVVFPRRKELLKQISSMFTQDVSEFSEYAGQEENRKKHPPFELREEIKAFQMLAKELSLDAAAFKETRQKLTACWDFLKTLDEKKPIEVVKKEEPPREDRDKQRRSLIEEFKKRLSEAKTGVADKETEELLRLKMDLQKELTGLMTTHAEKELLEHGLKEFRDLIHEKKEKALASLSDDERNSFDHLNERLEDLQLQRQEINKQLETYRLAMGGSGFDFEKAFYYRGLFDQEKERLDKISESIEEIEEKIEELENQSL
jgi:hypothetical protein